MTSKAKVKKGKTSVSFLFEAPDGFRAEGVAKGLEQPQVERIDFALRQVMAYLEALALRHGQPPTQGPPENARFGGAVDLKAHFDLHMAVRTFRDVVFDHEELKAVVEKLPADVLGALEAVFETLARLEKEEGS